MNTTRVVGAGVPRYTLSLAFQVRCSSTLQEPRYQRRRKDGPKKVPPRGSKIYAFNHLQTNRVVYSLTKVIDNRNAIEQITYVGKKSVPPTIRKDHWLPFFEVTFPNTPTTTRQGLDAYRMLREYRVMHETAWDLSLRRKAKEMAHRGVIYSIEELREKDKDFRKALLKKERKMLGHILADQKANSVADIAAVLAKLNFVHADWRNYKKKDNDAEKDEDVEKDEGVEKESTIDTEEIPSTEAESTTEDSTEVEPETEELLPRVAPDTAPILVQWYDIKDAEYAQSWPLGVVHAYMASTRHASSDPDELDHETILAELRAREQKGAARGGRKLREAKAQGAEKAEGKEAKTLET